MLVRYPFAVVVRFKAVGNAPIMKQNFFRVTVSNRFQAVIQFLRKELNWKAGEPLVSERWPVPRLRLRGRSLCASDLTHSRRSSRISILRFPPRPMTRSQISIA